MEIDKKRPIIIWILSGLILVWGLVLFFGGLWIFLSDLMTPSDALNGLGIFLGVGGMVGGGLISFTSIGFWKGKGWAKIVVIIFSVLGILSSISQIPLINVSINDGGYGGQFNIWILIMPIISIVLLAYLTFNHTAKEFFRNKE